MTTPRPETLLTVQEIATMMHVSKMSVYRLINTTFELRAFRVGRSLRVRETDLREFLANAAVVKGRA